MKVDGVEVFAYCVSIEGAQLFGLDDRPLAVLEAEWLARWQESGQRFAAAEQRSKRGQLMDAVVAKRVVEDGGDIDVVDEKGVHGLSPVEFQTPNPGEVFRLRGVQTRGGAGSLSHLACEVEGIACVPGAPGIVAGFLQGTSAPSKPRGKKRR